MQMLYRCVHVHISMCRERNRAKEREMFHLLIHFTDTMAGVGSDQSQESLGFLPGLSPIQFEGSKHMSHLLMLSQELQQGAELDVVQPGLKLVSVQECLSHRQYLYPNIPQCLPQIIFLKQHIIKGLLFQMETHFNPKQFMLYNNSSSVICDSCSGSLSLSNNAWNMRLYTQQVCFLWPNIGQTFFQFSHQLLC